MHVYTWFFSINSDRILQWAKSLLCKMKYLLLINQPFVSKTYLQILDSAFEICELDFVLKDNYRTSSTPSQPAYAQIWFEVLCIV